MVCAALHTDCDAVQLLVLVLVLVLVYLIIINIIIIIFRFIFTLLGLVSRWYSCISLQRVFLLQLPQLMPSESNEVYMGVGTGGGGRPPTFKN